MSVFFPFAVRTNWRSVVVVFVFFIFLLLTFRLIRHGRKDGMSVQRRKRMGYAVDMQFRDAFRIKMQYGLVFPSCFARPGMNKYAEALRKRAPRTRSKGRVVCPLETC